MPLWDLQKTTLTEWSLTNGKFVQSVKQNTALGRMGKRVSMARVIVFASSSDASYITGSDLLVNGDWMIT